MIKVQLDSIVNSLSALTKLSVLDLKPSILREVKKLLKKVPEETKLFEEIRMQKAKEYGILDTEKNQYVFDVEKAELFNNAIKELLLVEIELNVNKLEFSDIFDEKTKFDAKSLLDLDWLINDYH